MHDEMRRKDRKITENEAQEILKKCDYGVLATVDKYGFPYGVPVNYIYDNGRIYFHCAKSVGRKLKNIQYSGKVCFTVVGDTKVLPDKFGTLYESVIVNGYAAEAAENREAILTKILLKYCSDYMAAGTLYMKSNIESDKVTVYEIKIEEICGKARRQPVNH